MCIVPISKCRKTLKIKQNQHTFLIIVQMVYILGQNDSITINDPISQNEIIARKVHKRGKQSIQSVFVIKWYTNII